MNGAFLNQTGGTLSLLTAGDTLNTGALDNLSAVTVGNGASIVIAGAYTQDDGVTTIQANGAMSAEAFFLSGGTLLVDGLLDPANVVIGHGGELVGRGVITADLTNAGTISPGTGLVPGALAVDGDYTQSALGFFEEEISATDAFGALFDSGVATLDGTLDISLLNGYVPDVGTTFFFLNASAVNGAFANVNGLDINGLENFEVIYSGSAIEVLVEATPTPEPGSFVLLAGAFLAWGWFMARLRGRLPGAGGM